MLWDPTKRSPYLNRIAIAEIPYCFPTVMLCPSTGTCSTDLHGTDLLPVLLTDWLTSRS